MEIAVASDEALIITRVLPMRIVVSSLWGSSFIVRNSSVTRLDSFARYLALAMPMEKRAVSEDEKKAVSNKNNNNKISSPAIY